MFSLAVLARNQGKLLVYKMTYYQTVGLKNHKLIKLKLRDNIIIIFITTNIDSTTDYNKKIVWKKHYCCSLFSIVKYNLGIQIEQKIKYDTNYVI